MMTDWRNETEALTLKGQIKMPYTWSVGETGSRFLVALRDEQKILANRCSGCGKVYVPPRKNCATCFTEISTENWLELGNEGTVTAFTVVRYAYPLQPVAPPFAYAIIQL
ncbi:MAG: zinc ribbon domain-containing protein, partial [Chloroflexi bacterium]|nr:zinc ribbon domain-containing protein [Chloroflexota bacterium]